MIGCVIVYEGRSLPGYNSAIKEEYPVHAEMNAIRKAQQISGDWRLEDARCILHWNPVRCGAEPIVQARVDEVVINSMNAKAGCAKVLC